MTSLSSSFQIHSPSIPTPNESDSSLRAFLTPADHPIFPLSQSVSRVELVEETAEIEEYQQIQNLANLSLEQRLCSRDAEQTGVAKLLSL
jgi:hypothetical protein